MATQAEYEGRLPWEKAYPACVDWHMEMPVRPLFALLDDAVAAYPDHTALSFLGRRYSYRDLGELVDRTAAGLRTLGVGKGVKVGLYLPNCPYYVICFFAILKAGGTVVNCNPLLAERELMAQVDDAGAEIMITLDLVALYPRVAACLGRTGVRSVIVCSMADSLPFPQNMLFRMFRRGEVAAVGRDPGHVAFRDLRDHDEPLPPIAIDPRTDLAVLQYTGGTTGRPKGVGLTHFNLVANATQVRAWFTGAENGGERVVGLLPFFHAFGMTAVMNFALCMGAEVIVLPRFELKTFVETIANRRATLLFAVPTVFAAMAAHRDLGAHDLSSVKACICGGDALPTTIHDTFERKIGLPLAEGYGLTECSPVVACSNPLEGVERPGACGLPLPGTEIAILSLEDGRTWLSTSETGEICIAGPQVMTGYWRREEETRAAMIDGWLRSGDVGYLDQDGFLHFVGRLKEVIVTTGYKVYPRVVEDAIATHPAVSEVSVIGISDRLRGQFVKAFVVRAPGHSLEADELTGYLADRLSALEIPRRIEFRDSLPRSPLGKPLKRALLDEESRRRAQG